MNETNHYAPPLASTLEADPEGRPERELIDALRRTGFWTIFLGCVGILALAVIVIAFLLKAPSRSTVLRSGGTAETIGFLVLGIGALVSLCINVCLLMFGAAARGLGRHATFIRLKGVVALQRVVWVLIGMVSLLYGLFLVFFLLVELLGIVRRG